MSSLNVITFEDAEQARELLSAMTRLSATTDLELRDAVFVTRDDDGKVKVHETADLTAKGGALAGGFWGVLLGTLLAGPVGGLAIGGLAAGSGALMGRLVDAGVDDKFVEQMRDAVRPGETALILLTDHGDLEQIETELEQFRGGRLVWSNLPDEARAAVEEALAEGHHHPDVEHTADPPS